MFQDFPFFVRSISVASGFDLFFVQLKGNQKNEEIYLNEYQKVMPHNIYGYIGLLLSC